MTVSPTLGPTLVPPPLVQVGIAVAVVICFVVANRRRPGADGVARRWFVVGGLLAWAWILLWMWISVLGLLALDACPPPPHFGAPDADNCEHDIVSRWWALMLGEVLIAALTLVASTTARSLRLRVLALCLAAVAVPVSAFWYFAAVG